MHVYIEERDQRPSIHSCILSPVGGKVLLLQLWHDLFLIAPKVVRQRQRPTFDLAQQVVRPSTCFLRRSWVGASEVNMKVAYTRRHWQQ
jgi:hypothetical protein